MWWGLQLEPFVNSFIWIEARSVPNRGWGHGLLLPSTGQSDPHRKPPRLLLRRDTWLLSQSAWSPNLYPWGPVCSSCRMWMLPYDFFRRSFSPSSLPPELHLLPLSQLKSSPPFLHSPFIAPVVQYKPYVTLIQKQGKDAASETKCRSISPMNMDADILNKTLVKLNISMHSKDLGHQNQVGFISEIQKWFNRLHQQI